MKNIVYLYLLIALVVSSCRSSNSLGNEYKNMDIDYMYETAKAYYLDGNYNKASDLLETMVTMLKGGDKAEESIMLLAMCYYNSKDYETASQYFKLHYSNYPRGEYAEYSRFYSGKSLYMDITEPELDQSGTYVAINELQLFMEYFPLSKYRDEAQDLIAKMQDVLVKKEYLSAKLYYDLGDYMAYMGNNYEACIITAQNVLKDFPYTALREDISMLILKARYKMARSSVLEKKVERYRNTVDEYYAFKTEFPESKYLEEAEKYYNEASKFVENNKE
ncbi:MAG: outer membrane protein assembly factor BamD [Bacteroidaceae bacterium]|nr:outer membrane protein assembly factor BamD [Bacteroidaceae bacterium]